MLAGTRDIRLKSLAVEGVVVEGARARARANAELTGADASTGGPSPQLGRLRRAVSLVREASGWKAWRYVPVEQELADALASAPSAADRQSLLRSEAEFVTLDLVRLLLNAAEARAGGGAGGALHARELMGRDLTTELAVLSACDTASGRRAAVARAARACSA